MPKLRNITKNLEVDINVYTCESKDANNSLNDHQQWIPVTIVIRTPYSEVGYKEGNKIELSIGELNNIINNINEVTETKDEEKIFQFGSREGYFTIYCSKVREDDLISFSIWFEIGELTSCEATGYSKGFKFYAYTADVKIFSEALEKAFRNVN